ncbi:hypothetical protein [Pontibacter vulgaris]|uniref:hypothetical protein n=1 Tax=Pontibacter vulgaris TaxID=2905679 RepID=UPI001FA7A16F|nr:hypothetical protein [Pontibacter vulgaris]
MKRLIWILLAIGTIAQPLSKTGTYLLFQANRAYIASQLCEQRHFPLSDCQGKCYLKKQLKKAAEREQKTPATQKRTSPDLVCLEETFRLRRPYLQPVPKQLEAPYTIKKYLTPASYFFHPPDFMA